MRRVSAVFALLLAGLLVCGCGGMRKTSTGVIVKTPAGPVSLCCLTPSIVRVVKPMPGVAEFRDTSFSVILRPQDVKFRLKREAGRAVLTTDSLTVCVDLSDGSVAFESASGRPLLREKSCSRDSLSQSFALDPDEAVYGLGQHRYGSLNWRGCEVDLYHRNMDISIPLVHSIKGYALYLDNTSRSHFADRPDGMTLSSDSGSAVDYYFVYGGDADGVISGLHELSGCAPMNALWSYGFIQSKNSYLSWDEMAGVVERYRSLGVPLDAIVLDYAYPAHHGDLEFSRPDFDGARQGIDRLHALNARCIISIWPSFAKNSPYYRQFAEQGLLIPTAAQPDSSILVYDASSARARDIYWSHIEANLLPSGVDGWWMDATEPEFKSYYVPTASDNAVQLALGTFGDIQLAYPMLTSMGVYEHQRACSEAKRVFILTRSGTFGQQRYAAQCWSGDTDGVMEELRRQIPAALNYGLSGLSYWTSDIGGYFCDYEGGNRNPDYKKVYARWFQFATFSSIMRSHGMHTPREIYQWGSRGDVWFDNQEKFIRLRYALLPYTYSLAHAVSLGGDVFMRPLFMDWPGDPAVRDLEDEFLYGRSILAAPLTNLESVRSVYLPDGVWYDFWSGAEVPAGLVAEREYAIDEMPVYVRGGSIMPVGPDVQYASEKPWDTLQLRIYPGADACFDLYMDEGDGYAYEKGACSVIPLRWDDASRTLTIGRRIGSYPGMPETVEFRVVVAGEGKANGLDISSCDVAARYTGEALSLVL